MSIQFYEFVTCTLIAGLIGLRLRWNFLIAKVFEIYSWNLLKYFFLQFHQKWCILCRLEKICCFTSLHESQEITWNEISFFHCCVRKLKASTVVLFLTGKFPAYLIQQKLSLLVCRHLCFTYASKLLHKKTQIDFLLSAENPSEFFTRASGILCANGSCLSLLTSWFQTENLSLFSLWTL